MEECVGLLLMDLASFITPWTATAMADWATQVPNGCYAVFLYQAQQLINTSDQITPQWVGSWR